MRISRLALACSFLIISGILNAQEPAGYYSAIDGKTGFELKTGLHTIIKGHNSRGYSALWGFISSNDIDTYYENDGTILDIYSENPASSDPYNFTKVSDQCGSYSGEGSCYNREHSFPKSWFGGSNEPMNSDVHHLFATDGKVNSIRGNYPYGDVASASQTSQNGSKVGSSSSASGYSGTVFEPIDEFKGDVARAHFYMATRYQDVISSWQSNTSQSNDVLDGSSDKVFEDWMLNVLLEWHANDPVSQKEIDRNNAAYSYQGNRNPFVDHPEFVSCIWGDECGTIVPPDTTAPVDTTDPDTVVVDQTCKYILFPTSQDKPMWSEQLVVTRADGSEPSIYNTIYGLISDTSISGHRYSKLYRLKSNIYSASGGQYVGGIRSDSCGYVYYLSVGGVEQILYDFSKEVGDSTIMGHDESVYFISEETNIDLADGSETKVLSMTKNEYLYKWVQGIGNLKGLLAHISVYPTDAVYETKLLCYLRNNKLLFKEGNGTCFPENSGNTGFLSSPNRGVVVYPQPADEYLKLSFESMLKGNALIYNLTGQELLSQSIYGATAELDIRNLPTGTYILFITNNQGESILSLPIVIE